MLPQDLGNRHTGLAFPQNRDDLRLRKLRLLHAILRFRRSPSLTVKRVGQGEAREV